MIEYRDECVGCPPELGCLGENCPNKNKLTLVCDDCGDEVSDLWYGEDGGMYCKTCIHKYIEKVVEE